MSLVTTLKELYYGNHQIGEVNSNGSTVFVRCMRAVMDGHSRMVREANPFLAAYSQVHASSLYWRTSLFGDQVALDCLRSNITTFYQKGEIQ